MIKIAVPRLNEIGMGSRRTANPMHGNDVGMKQRVRGLANAPIHGNDVGLGNHMGAPAIRSSARGMTKTELHSKRLEVGKMPRA